MTDDDSQFKEAHNQPAPLSKSERRLAGAIGAVFSTAGIVSIVILGRDGAGSLALVAVGALFLLVGAVETIPSVFKVGSNEMTVRRTAAQAYTLRKGAEAQDKLAEGDAEGAREALDSIANPPEPELALTPLSLDFARARNDILNHTRRWARSVGGELALHPRTPYAAYIVLMEKRVAIDLQHLAFDPAAAMRVAKYTTDFVGAVTGIALIYRRDVWEYSGAIQRVEAIVQSEYNVPIRSVLWGARDQYAQLELALRVLLDLPLATAEATLS